jgi:hypothetical protein
MPWAIFTLAALCYRVRWQFGWQRMATDLELLAHREADHAAVAWALGLGSRRSRSILRETRAPRGPKAPRRRE